MKIFTFKYFYEMIGKAGYTPEAFRMFIRNGDFEGIEKLYESCHDNIEHNFSTYESPKTFKKDIKDELERFRYEAVLGGFYKKESNILNTKFCQLIDETRDLEICYSYFKKSAIAFAKRTARSPIFGVTTPILTRAANYIHDNIGSKVKCQEVANYIKCSEQYLGKLFRKELGKSVSTFILEEKINASINYIKNGNIKINEIPDKLGFCSHSHFIKAFKQVTGTTPHKYYLSLKEETKIS